MSTGNFFRIYIGLISIGFIILLLAMSINISSSKEITVYHSKYFKLDDYVRTGRVSMGFPFLYTGYSIEVDDMEINFPEKGLHRVKLSEETSLLCSIRLICSIDTSNIDFIVNRFGYEFDKVILRNIIKDTLESFIFSIPKLSVITMERLWVNERLKELLSAVLLENGIILEDFSFNNIEIDRKQEKVGESKAVKKPDIIVLYIPGLDKGIYNPIRKEFPNTEYADIKNSALFADGYEAEKVLITGKMPHKSMLYFDNFNYDFDKYRSKYIWEIFDYYSDSIMLLFPAFFSPDSDKIDIVPEMKFSGRHSSEDYQYLLRQYPGMGENEFSLQKDHFEKEFFRLTKLSPDGMDHDTRVLVDKLFVELYATKEGLMQDKSLFMSFIRSLDELTVKFIRYSFPRDPNISVRDYMKYNMAVKGVRNIVESYIKEFVRNSGKNSIIIIINPYQYKDASKKPSALVMDKRSYLQDHGFALFIKNDISRETRLNSQSVNLLDFFPSILSLYDFPSARDNRGENFFRVKEQGIISRLINSYDGILKNEIIISGMDDTAVPGNRRFNEPEIFIPDRSVLDKDEDKAGYLEYLTEIADEYPFISEIDSKAGLVSYLAGDMAKAEVYYSRYIISNPYSPKGFYNLGSTYARTGDFEKAAESYINAYSVSGMDKEILNSIAYAFIKLNNIEQAGYYFNLSLALDEDQKEIIDFLSRYEYSDNIGADVYNRAIISFYEIRSENVTLINKVLASISKFDYKLINAGLLRSIESQTKGFRFKEVKIRKAELNKELEKYIDNVPIFAFSDVFNTGGAYISLYKFDIDFEN